MLISIFNVIYDSSLLFILNHRKLGLRFAKELYVFLCVFNRSYTVVSQKLPVIVNILNKV